MSTAYWSQWNHAELMSMFGVELETEVDADFEQEEKHFCGNCMNCLGLSWKDFM